MADYIPKFHPGQAVTFTASADVVGGRLVEVTGDRSVGPAGAKSAKVAGVAARDAVAGEHVLVHVGGVQTLPATAAVVAGASVAAAAAGAVVTAVGDSAAGDPLIFTAGDPVVGLALTAAADAGDIIEVLI